MADEISSFSPEVIEKLGTYVYRLISSGQRPLCSAARIRDKFRNIAVPDEAELLTVL
jgi:hypothetical protein